MQRVAILLAVLATAAPFTTAGQGASAQRPNVVLIMTDDVGYGDIGVYGAPDVKTPNIDRLARAGVRLTDFYANGATCTPTRTGLITGRYQQRLGLEMPLGAGGEADRERGLPAVGRSLPLLLRNSGYTTALVGKWQVPDKPSTARDNARHLGPFDDSTSTRADYVAMLERADLGVGRILRALDSLGLRQNTIVIFTNDNGGEWLSRNAPFFHHKGSVWEGGIRVPAIIRWPGRIPAGKVSDQVGITMDLTVSILAATGTPDPARADFEGMNLLPVLEGRSAKIERTLFWRVQGQQAVRSGDWKLMLDRRPMLFNLRKDPGERTNVVGWHPEIARRLRDALAKWVDDVDAEAKRAGVT